MMTSKKFVCPETKEALSSQGGFLTSSSGRRYPVRKNGKVDFIGIPEMESSAHRDGIDQLKSIFKRALGKRYTLFVNIFSPVMPRIDWPTGMLFLRKVVQDYSEGKKDVIQVGSGNFRLLPEIHNIDIFDYPEVDTIADGTKLPFADNSLDVFITMAVMEHVQDPHQLLEEAHRVLRPGGIIISAVPFIQGFHASPHDHTRWTLPGLELFHQQHGFKTKQIEPASGPTSSFLWIAQEWLAMLLSLNIQKLYYFWLTFLMVATVPLKLLDLLMIHHKEAHRIASTCIFVGEK